MNTTTASTGTAQLPTIRDLSGSSLLTDITRSITDHLAGSEQIVRPEGADGGHSEVPLRVFYERFRTDGGAGYVRDLYIRDTHHDLEHRIYDQLGISNWFLHADPVVRPPWFWLFAGGTGTGSLLHLDIMNSAAWNIVLSGEKRWEIQSPALGVERRVLPRSFLTLPGVETAKKSVSFVQRPGELVLLPSGWCHAVQNVGPTVAITGNYVGDNNHQLVRHYLSCTGEEAAIRQLDNLMRTTRQD
ncbi:hypothetical protein ACWDV4_18005 [Micromonospora sp. NPDC003197]